MVTGRSLELARPFLVLVWVVGFACGDDGAGGETSGVSTTRSTSSTGSGSGSSTGGTPTSESTSAGDAAEDGGPCFLECTSTLAVALPDGVDAFTLEADFGPALTGTITCPGSEATGWLLNPAMASCIDNRVIITLDTLRFPALATFIVDGGEAQEVMPDYTENVVCPGEVECNDAEVVIEGPTAGTGTGTTS